MNRLTLVRWCLGDFGTFGWLEIAGRTVHTVERAWADNQPNVSCIPEGVYACVPGRYNRGGYDAIEVLDVPGRSLIKFHKANWPSQLAGCIAPNVEVRPGTIACPMRGYNSAGAFRLLMEHYGHREFELEIIG